MRHASLLAICAALAASTYAIAANAQSAGLPPTNMGKFVHQPGDNQYSQGTQAERHPPTPVFVPRPQAAAGGNGGGGGGYVPTPRVPRADPTLESIAADEPVVVAGFPPLPDRADLPVESGWGSGSSGWGSSSGGSGGAGGAAAGGPPQSTGVHQHYQHFDAGAWMPPKQASPSQGYGHAGPAAGTGAPPSSGPTHGGYNHLGADFYSSSGGAGAPAGGGSPAQQALRELGKEPKLNSRADQGIVPEAPVPVSIKQSTTQDLSLPDDEFSTKNSTPKQPSPTGQMFKQMGRNLLMTPMSGMSGMSGSMMGRIHF